MDGNCFCQASVMRLAHLLLDHAFGFQLADVGPAAIEVQRQCRRADGRGLSGSGAINGEGLSHRVRSCCVAARYSDYGIRVNGAG
jgi:hypothetical protein